MIKKEYVSTFYTCPSPFYRLIQKKYFESTFDRALKYEVNHLIKAKFQRILPIEKLLSDVSNLASDLILESLYNG